MLTNEIKYSKNELGWLIGPKVNAKPKTQNTKFQTLNLRVIFFFYRWIAVFECMKSKRIQLNT
jgi:SUMO ligase MMS21 Smc5/6 complex component